MGPTAEKNKFDITKVVVKWLNALTWLNIRTFYVNFSSQQKLEIDSNPGIEGNGVFHLERPLVTGFWCRWWREDRNSCAQRSVHPTLLDRTHQNMKTKQMNQEIQRQKNRKKKLMDAFVRKRRVMLTHWDWVTLMGIWVFLVMTPLMIYVGRGLFSDLESRFTLCWCSG